MGWTGKTIGAIAGSAFGPAGIFVGGWLGHCFDSGASQKEAEDKAAYQHEYRSRMNILAIAVCAAYANDVLHPNERKCLQYITRDLFGDISDAEIDEKIREIRSHRLTVQDCANLFMGVIPEARGALAWMLMSVLHADGGECGT